MKKFEAIDSSFFAANRTKLKSKFSHMPIVIAGNGLVQRTRDDDAFPFQQSANFWYLSGVDEPDMILVIHGSEEFIILPQRDPRFEIFSGTFDKEKIKEASGVSIIYSNKEGWDKLRNILKKSKQVGTFKPESEYNRFYNVYTNPVPRRLVKRLKYINKNLKIVDIRSELADMRSIKSEAEIRAISYAIEHTAEVLTQISSRFNDFKTEKEIEAELMYYAVKHDLRQSFLPIIANGKNSCTLHYQTNRAIINKNEITLLDIGYAANGYSADITRVMCLKPNKRQEAVHTAVIEIQNYALSLLKPGVMPQKYEKQVAEFAGEKLRQLGLIHEINPNNIYKHFRHRTSHFLGLDVHDVGDYSKPFQAGMVITVEPGIYIDEEAIGVRIEDDVLITSKGVDVLSKNLSRQIKLG